MRRPQIFGRGQALNGDWTTTGASLISTIPSNATTDRRGMVRRGDPTTVCPKCGKTGVVVEGESRFNLLGKPIALDGHLVSCSCPIGSNRIIAPLGELSSGPAGGSYPAQSVPIPSLTPYVAQICLTCPNGSIPKGLNYVVFLADGTTRKGVTDHLGRIEQVTTQEATRITRLELMPPEASESGCCIAKGTDEPLVIDLKASELSTDNSPNGAAIQTISLPEGEKRALTSGEIAMARIVFKDSIDYSQVKIHHGGWWLFLGLQNTAVTPNGEMYFPQKTYLYSDDFSSTNDDRDKALFIHEMTHVWQYQLGYWVKWHALWVTSRGASAYEYQLNPSKKLSNYNMEQQGEIISDYFIICVLKKPESVWNSANQTKSPTLLQSTMQDFLKNPSDISNLPE
ncbi:PAAR domain-containing protein [Pseudomonas denitrificans (nom. rej.)]|uniref:PAAR domain-containing protein n=1 Tax=Pseudomonas denitrificans TaxID=43306 RepID=A0A9X7MY52_PSEDE|nr:PAAR domain-containing protein [Pseudomonas denitrificans (nom. rej.)]QEY71491.1 PAAR domain-containing protein [Pseudomonas denitrificans (nom. rej.)]